MAVNEFRRFDESPRQVISGLALLMTLIWVACTANRNNDGNNRVVEVATTAPGESFRLATGGTLLVLMTYCFLNTRDGRLKNPHPGL